MNKLLLLLSLVVGITMFSTQEAKAQSAVYFDPNNGAIGYAYGYSNANQVAYNNAINYGAQNPYRVLYVGAKGYGAIVLGTNVYGSRVIGAAAGYQTLEQARYFATQGALRNGATQYSTYVFKEWLDNQYY